MFWLDLLLAPALILLPVAMTLFWRSPPDVPVDADRIRRLNLRLWAGTLAVLAVFVLLRLAEGPVPARFAWVLSFLLLPLAIQLMNLRNPNLVAHDPVPTVRTASLGNRQRENPVPAFVLLLLWLLWAADLAAVLARLLFPLDNSALVPWATALLGASVTVLTPWLTAWAIRKTMEEPEPMDDAGSAELAEAYAQHRAFRAWGFAVFGFVMILTFSAFNIVLAWVPLDVQTGPLLGIVGGIVGSLVGIAGGVFGTIASIRRAHITALLRRLQGQAR